MRRRFGGGRKSAMLPLMRMTTTVKCPRAKAAVMTSGKKKSTQKQAPSKSAVRREFMLQVEASISSCFRATSSRGSTTDSSFRHPPGGSSAMPLFLDHHRHHYRHRHHHRRLRPQAMPPEWSTSAKLGTAGSRFRAAVRCRRIHHHSDVSASTRRTMATKGNQVNP